MDMSVTVGIYAISLPNDHHHSVNWGVRFRYKIITIAALCDKMELL